MVAVQPEIAVPSLTAPVFAVLSLHVCRTWDELEHFRGPWNSLLQASPAASIFQTPEWLAAWWKAFGQDQRLLGLIFTNQAGNVLGIAPLYAERTSFLGVSLTTLRMVGAGSGDSDALDFIVSPGYEQSCAEAFTAWLADNTDWHVCSMEALPQDSLVAQHLFQQVQEAGWSVDTIHTPNFVVDFPASWPQYLSMLEPAFRPLLIRYPKRLQSRFSVRIVRCEQVEDLADRLQTLFGLHQMRWTGRGEPGAFASADRRDFYLHMATVFLHRGWLEFWLLELDGETVGAQFCFRYNDTVYLLQEGFHPKHTAEKIGYALRAHVLEEMIRTGARRYDFLGGADAYKAKFGARQANYLNLFFAGPSFRGRAYLALQKQKRQFKTWLKGKLPAGVLAALGRDSKRQPPSPVKI